MFKADDLERALDCALDSPATTAAIAMLVLLMGPVVASSGASSIESRETPRSAVYQEHHERAYSYQMRCWQHGRLLFEQSLVELPSDGTRYALEVGGSDRDGRRVYVAKTPDDATCLIRSAADAGAPTHH